MPVELEEPRATVEHAVERVRCDPFAVWRNQALAGEPPAFPRAVERRHVVDLAVVEP